MRYTAAFFLVAVLVTVAFAFFPVQFYSPIEGEGVVSIGDAQLQVRFADTPAERAQGLSGSPPLRDDEGMLFVFPQPERPGFWMKDMRFPIDILWISGEKRVIGFEEQVVPESYPRAYRPTEDILYVLEVPEGFVKKHRISVGSEVTF